MTFCTFPSHQVSAAVAGSLPGSEDMLIVMTVAENIILFQCSDLVTIAVLKRTVFKLTMKIKTPVSFILYHTSATPTPTGGC